MLTFSIYVPSLRAQSFPVIPKALFQRVIKNVNGLSNLSAEQ